MLRVNKAKAERFGLFKNWLMVGREIYANKTAQPVILMSLKNDLKKISGQRLTIQ